MHFEAYANRVISLNDFTNQKVKNIQQNKFQIKNTEIRMQSISKSRFAGLNDKDAIFMTVLFLCLLVIIFLKS